MGLPIGDCRLSIEKRCDELYCQSAGQSAIDNRQSTIPQDNRQSTINNPLGCRRLQDGGGKRVGLHFRLELDLLMRPVAEGFILRMATTAKANRSSPTQVECLALRIVDCEFPFNPQ